MTTDAPKLPMPPKPLKPPRNTEHAAGRSCPTCAPLMADRRHRLLSRLSP